MASERTSAGKDEHARFSGRLEALLISVILGLMTVVTFANVIARYVFNTNILWALELTVFLFAWLVLLGVSHCIKETAHLGVDALLNIVSPAARRVMTVIAGGCCILFSVLLLIGAWRYWAPFASKNAWYEVNDIPMPEMFQFLAVWMNEGERYEKLPRFIPYVALPLGMGLMLWRFVEATWQVFRGERDLLIASHEVEDAVARSSPVAPSDGGGGPQGPTSGG